MNTQLIIDFHWLVVKATHETNSKRGMSKKTYKELDDILQAISEEYDLNIDELRKGINK
jgi:thermostable 8-oxoguanine DNA glycosylase